MDLASQHAAWFDALVGVAYVVDRDLRMIGANAAWDKFAIGNHGPLLESLRGMWLPSGISEPERRRVVDICQQVMSTGTPCILHEQDYSEPDRERFLDLAIAPWRDAAGRIAGLVFYSTDVTERVVASRLAEGARVAQSRLQGLARGVRTMVHAAASPLTELRIALDLAKQGVPLEEVQGSIEEGVAQLGTVLQELRKAARSVDDLDTDRLDHIMTGLGQPQETT